MVGLFLLSALTPSAAPAFEDVVMQPSLSRFEVRAIAPERTQFSGSILDGIEDAGMSGDANVDRILELTNQERGRNGLAPLRLSPLLSEAANWMARDMASKNYFDHLDSTGRRVGDRAYDFGYRGWKQIGENIAAGQESAERAMAEWVSSPGHYRNMMKPEYTEMGVGFMSDPASAHKRYWVQTFGTRPAYAATRYR